jgi:hypothetical protein
MPGSWFVLHNHICNLVADFHHGIQGIHGTLEHHGNVMPSHTAQFRIVQPQDVPAPMQDFASPDHRWCSKKAQDREGDGRFPAARFTGKSKNLAWLNGKGNIVYSADDTVIAHIIDPKVLDIE